MKKVIYSITKLGKTENTKFTGVGYITDEELITANVSATFFTRFVSYLL